MTAAVSHEIRNPLNAASLQLSLLERGLDALEVPERAPLMTTLGLVRAELTRLGHIVEDFVLMANPRPGRRRWLDVGALTHHVFDALVKVAEQNSVRVERRVGESQMAMVDEGQIRQVLMNVGLNAIEAAPANGVIAVTVAVSDVHLTITIDDSGPGVSAAIRERIFEPFFTTKALGPGLGLSIVRGIVAQHDGEVSVAESPLGGARFTVTLPATERGEVAR